MNDVKSVTVLKWIDPDLWGFRAWSLLFALARRLKNDPEKWSILSRLLPQVLPCHTCQCCCAKFITRVAPEQMDPVQWLTRLRSEIYARNLKHADCNRLDRRLKHIQSDQQIQTRFALRE